MNDIGFYGMHRRNAVQRQIIFIVSTVICLAIYLLGSEPGKSQKQLACSKVEVVIHTGIRQLQITEDGGRIFAAIPERQIRQVEAGSDIGATLVGLVVVRESARVVAGVQFNVLEHVFLGKLKSVQLEGSQDASVVRGTRSRSPTQDAAAGG